MTHTRRFGHVHTLPPFGGFEDMHGGKIQKIERDGLVAILWNTSVDMFVDKILLVDVTFVSVIFGETV